MSIVKYSLPYIVDLEENPQTTSQMIGKVLLEQSIFHVAGRDNNNVTVKCVASRLGVRSIVIESLGRLTIHRFNPLHVSYIISGTSPVSVYGGNHQCDDGA